MMNIKLPKLTKPFWLGYHKGLSSAIKINHNHMYNVFQNYNVPLTWRDKWELIWRPEIWIAAYIIKMEKEIMVDIEQVGDNVHNNLP